MKVGMLSSWDTQCGIAEYSRYIANSMWRRDNIDFHILGSRNYGAKALPKDTKTEKEGHVHHVFDVELWSDGKRGFDVDWILEQDYDVLHCQYEIILYPRPQLYDLYEEFKGVKAITYHDNCILPDFPFTLFNLSYTHREDVGVGAGYILPMGVLNKPPIIKTFGLGRSREDLIAEICYQNGWGFEKSFGEQHWKTQSELYAWLRDADAIVLYYDEVPAAGSSIAARLAASTRRPVFVNNTTWFRGIEAPNVHTVEGREGLERGLREALQNEYLERNSWDVIANTMVSDYTKVLNEL